MVSIIGPLCIADVGDRWGTEPSEVEEDELGDSEGDVVTTMEAEENWQTKSEGEALEVPARTYLKYNDCL